ARPLLLNALSPTLGGLLQGDRAEGASLGKWQACQEQRRIVKLGLPTRLDGGARSRAGRMGWLGRLRRLERQSERCRQHQSLRVQLDRSRGQLVSKCEEV